MGSPSLITGSIVVTATSKKSKVRRTTSLVLLLSAVVVAITSVILFIGPPTHIAYFSDWRLWGLAKDQWNSIHVVNGVLFVIACLVHVYINWKPMVSYLKTNMRVIVFTFPFLLAFVITTFVSVNAAFFLTPSRQIGMLGHSINQKHLRTFEVFPFNNPGAYPLHKVAIYLGVQPQEAVSALRDNGFIVDSTEQSVGMIAERNAKSVDEVIAEMRLRP